MDQNPSRVTKAYLEGPHGQIHVRYAGRQEGGKRALLCMHLSPGSSLMYADLLAEMGRDRFAVAVDTPGYGASDEPDLPVGIETLAVSMIAVLDHFGLEEVDVLGYHTGSKIAVALALAHPARVRSLVLVSAPVYTPEELERQRAALAVPRIPVRDGAHLVAQFAELVKWAPRGTPLALVQREFAEQQRGGDSAHWGYLAAFEYSHGEMLPLITQPLLLVCPGDDLEGPTLRAKSIIPGHGRFLHLPEWGHHMMSTRTEEVSALLREHSAQA